MQSNYHPFILPFCIGALLLIAIMAVKFCSWLFKLNKIQRKQCLKNIISFKTVAAIWECIRECLFHRNIFKRNWVLGYMHVSFALGWFMLIVVGKAEASCYSHTFWEEPWLAIFFRFFENGNKDFFMPELFTFVMDFILAWILSGIILAWCKRFYSRLLGMKKTTRHTWYDRIGMTALWCIFPFRLLAESTTAAIRHNGGWLTQTIGNLLSYLPVESIEMPLWWAYSIVLCIFFISLPFTRYMHIFAEILLVFLRKWGVTEDNRKSGYTECEANACSRCGICIDVCPLNTAAGFQNVQSVYFIRDLRQKRLTEEVTNNCLMCNRCVEACPVGIQSTLMRQIVRGEQKNINSDKSYYDYLPLNLNAANSTTGTTDTPTGDTTTGNTADTTDKTEKNSSSNHISDKKVLYFAGCMTHLHPNIIQSMRKLFNAAKVEWIFMDEERNLCCGRPLRQQGYHEQADQMQSKIKQIIQSSGYDILVTSCPICYHSFKQEYKLDIKVMHHTTYLRQLLAEGKIPLKSDGTRFAYHDPCELGRGEKIYDEPRQLLQAVGTLCKVESEKQDGLCCGHSLANTAIAAPKKNQIRDEALKVLCADNPDMIVTACPLCKSAFREGNSQKVEDIAEVLADKII